MTGLLSAFPLLDRELSRFGRQDRYFALRSAPAILACVIYAVFADEFVSLRTLQDIGVAIGTMCLLFQYSLALFGCAAWTADNLAREKEERTLPLLLLADMRGMDIVLAKFASAFAPVLLMILGTAPLLLVADTGSIPVSAVIFQGLHITAIAALGSAVGLACAIITNSRGAALRLALVLMAAYSVAVLTGFNGAPPWSSSFPFLFWVELQFLSTSEPLKFFAAVAVPAWLSFALLRFVARRIPEEAMARPAVPTAQTPAHHRRQASSPDRQLIRQLLGWNLTSVTGRVGSVLFLLTLTAFALVPFAGNAVLTLWLLFYIGSSIERLASSEAVDELRLAYPDDSALGAAVRSTILRRTWAYGLIFPLGFIWAISELASNRSDMLEIAVLVGLLIPAGLAQGATIVLVAASTATTTVTWLERTIAAILVYGAIKFVDTIIVVGFAETLAGAIRTFTGNKPVLFLGPTVLFLPTSFLLICAYILYKGFPSNFALRVRRVLFDMPYQSFDDNALRSGE